MGRRTAVREPTTPKLSSISLPDLRSYAPFHRNNVVSSAFHDSPERHSAPRCHPHTRQAILTKIMRWLEDPTSDPRILWMYGFSGSGKTAIAQAIAERCTQAGRTVASFFFSRTISSHDTGEKLVPSLAYQLSQSIPEIRDSIARALLDDPLLPSRRMTTQAWNLIIQPLNTYFMFASRPQDHDGGVAVILDGLDECRSEEDQREILGMLSYIAVRCRFPFFVLVASRPEQAIRAAFANEPLQSLTFSFALHYLVDLDSDIRAFLRAEFNDIKENYPVQHSLPPAWPSEQEIEWLVEKSSGQFIYASSVAKFVGSLRHNPANRLDIVLGKVPQSPFHQELDAIYRQLFSSTIHVEEIIEIFSLLLLCKSMSSQPSIVDEFLSYTPGSTRTILSGLHSVLLVPSESPKDKGIDDGMIKITLNSLSDFLLDHDRSAEFFVDANVGRSKITRRLLIVLLKEGYSQALKDACKAALPEVLEDLYEIDLPQFVVFMSPSDLNSTHLEDWEFVSKFFLWMKHQSHPNRKSDLFHHHLPAIDRWIHNLISRLRPQSLITKVTSITFLSNAEIETVAPGRSRGVDILLTISELESREIGSRPARTELSFHAYTLAPTAFGILLHQFMVDHSRGIEYQLNGEKCARLARTLWMYVLPYKVRKSLMDKRFGPPYPAPLTFHRFKGVEIPNEEELSLLLLPKILPKVPEAGTDSLVEFLKIVQEHPLLKYFHPTNELYWLQKEVSDAAEQYLRPDLFKRLEPVNQNSNRKSEG